MKFFAPLVVLLLQGVLAAPTPENGEFECCPKGTPPCPDPPECTCPENSHWDWCGSACPETCCDDGCETECGSWCIPGCVCDDGYVLNNDGECVCPNECDPDECCDIDDEQSKKFQKNKQNKQNRPKKAPSA